MDLKSVIDTRRSGSPDLTLFLAVFILAGIGLSFVYSASAVFALRVFHDAFYFFKHQFVWLACGLVIVILFQNIDYRVYQRYTKYMILLAIVALVSVYIPGIGHAAKGSVRWLSLGFIKIQPSEFVKLAMVIYITKVFSNQNSKSNPLHLLFPVILLSVMFMLIMLQPDFGTAIDLLFVSVAVFFVSGFPLLYMLIVFIVSLPAFYLLIYQVSYRWHRILAFLDPWSNRYGIGYHITQGFIAFNNGGLLGTGLGYGTQKLSRLPEPHTDFIFAVIGEETGLIGTVTVVLLFCLVFWRGMSIALHATDDFGRLLSVGLTLMIVIQGFLNIGVVIGALPTTGVPLPFISYGGSSLLSNMIAVGILLNISKYRETVSERFKSDAPLTEVWQ
jgi:cell division protein FtsW